MKVLFIRIICTLAAGLMIFRFGLLGMFKVGAAGIDASLVTSYLDSEYRFLSALALGIGGVFIYVIVTIRRNPVLLLILAGSVATGALMRVVTMGIYGAPGIDEIVPTAIEFTLPTIAVILTVLLIREQRSQAA